MYEYLIPLVCYFRENFFLFFKLSFHWYTILYSGFAWAILWLLPIKSPPHGPLQSLSISIIRCYGITTCLSAVLPFQWEKIFYKGYLYNTNSVEIYLMFFQKEKFSMILSSVSFPNLIPVGGRLLNHWFIPCWHLLWDSLSISVQIVFPSPISLYLSQRINN